MRVSSFSSGFRQMNSGSNNSSNVLESPVKSPRGVFNSPVFKSTPAATAIPPLDFSGLGDLKGGSGVSFGIKDGISVKGELIIRQKVEEPFVEPILRENPNRFTLFPVQKQALYNLYKKHVAVFWVTEELDLTKDLKDWVKLTENEQYFIKNILAFFAGSDGIVQENLATRFMSEVQLPEARAFYSVQNMMETIHSETYSLLIDTYIDDKAEKDKLFRAIQTIPCVKLKAEWAQKWIEDKEADFATRLIAFAIVEGIFFSGAFCAIFWLKERGLMQGLTVSNELISRDEGLHCEFACELYKEIERKLPKLKVHKIIREAVDIERQFITESLPCNLIGMNSELMIQYIKFVADRLSSQLGYGKIYNTTNPFDFMERISLEGKDNFFEKRVTSYAKAGVGKKQEEMSFSLDADF